MNSENASAATSPASAGILRYTAFTDDPSGGNRAGVVLDAAHLDDAAMLAVAAEVGYSETAFVTGRDARGALRVRYFAPLAEVDFCGHATIALAVALAERDGTGELVLETNSGEVRVATAADAAGAVTATLTSVPTRSRPALEEELDEALRALRWERGDLDPALPPHVAFGGASHLVLAAATRDRLARLDYDFDGLGAVMRRRGWTTVDLVWREADDLFHARNPFPVGGVVEDAATGAAAAAFGGWLRAIGRAAGPTRITVRQGEDMGRPSLLLVETGGPDDARVRVTGRAVPLPA